MSRAPLTPEEAVGLDNKREDRRKQQPYASELDDRELEHAQKDRRPVNPRGAAKGAPARPADNSKGKPKDGEYPQRTQGRGACH